MAPHCGGYSCTYSLGTCCESWEQLLDAFVLNKQTVSSRPSQNNLQRRTEYDGTPWKMPSAGPETLRSPLGCRVDYIRGSKVCHGGVMGVEVLS